MRNSFLFLLLGFGLLSCQSAPKKFDGTQKQGQWEARAQIKDFKRNQQHQVSLDMIGIWPHSLRAEVTGPMGVSLASLVMQQSDIAYQLKQQKKFFRGQLSEAALGPLFQIELNPKYLLNLCFDRPIVDKDWQCKISAEGLPEFCRRSSDQMFVVWKDRQGDQKRILIQRSDFEVQILFKKFKPLVQVKADVFQLNPPEDFKRIQLK